MTSPAKTQWGFAVPQVFLDGPVDMELVRKVATRAEAKGYHSLWVLEQTTREFANLEPVALLCYVAAITSRPRLGSSVILSPFRNPMLFAKELESLDQMSGGRLILGIGLGNAGRDYPAFGIPVKGRVRRFLEGVELLKASWTQPSVTHKGEFWQPEGFLMGPKPLQKPHPPIWFGGRHPNQLRRAVRHADGWMGSGGTSSTAEFKQQVQLLRQYLDEAGRDPSTFAISKRVYFFADRNKAQARRVLDHWFTRVYPAYPRGQEVAVWGTVNECTQQLAEVIAAGAQLIAVTPVASDLEMLDLVTEEIIPSL
ncbi:MAG: LLM class flavin-dependent oxidoreductase [Chloroflexi bacterium]|nr:LLM class flavin-dependent oxidoreductase [Chloroflexota bacterium]